ncbi:MAG: hypothetical protein GF320_20665 [Armatimonadia bacterium]|nr:hypothetical protein [Armatimonadia bacterium]
MGSRGAVALSLGLVIVAGPWQPARSDEGIVVTEASTLHATDYGLVADGVTDDGAAIAAMLAAASQATGPIVLRFPEDATIRVLTAHERYVFRLDGVESWTIDGGGSTFLLDPHIRFARVQRCRSVAIRDLDIDFDPLPFADGTITAVDEAARHLEVRLDDPTAPAPSGGPTGEDGEQAFFAMVWHESEHGTTSTHCWTELMEPAGEPGRVLLHAAESFNGYPDIELGRTRISLPVPGIAHRYGPGPCLELQDNNGLKLSDVEIWSAPWFACNVSRNMGDVTFTRVHIRPKPGSKRLMSTWRDGFHVKGNRGRLLWEDCILEGMNDDAFNISTHSSTVDEVSGSTVRVHQRFPLLPIPWEPGGTFRAVDHASGRLLGEATVVAAEAGPKPPPIQGKPAAPAYTLTLDEPIDDLEPGAMAWDPTWCNPDTTLRRCTIRMSCRLQSPVTVEACDVTALLWFYAEPIEGGYPHQVSVRDCVFRPGRGNPVHAVIFSGGTYPDAEMPDPGAPPRALRDVWVEGSSFYGGLRIEGVQDLHLIGNRFLDPDASVVLRGCVDAVVEDNTGPDGVPVELGVTRE